MLARTGGQDSWVGLLGNRLSSYVPDLYWLTVFGPPYVKLIGRERLLSLDAHRVMELPYGAISVQLSESPLDIRNNYEKVSALRAAIKQSIDNNIFFDPKLHPPDPHFVGRTTEELKAKMDAWYGAHRYNVPAFDMSDLKAPPLAQEVEVALRGVLEKRGMLTAMTLQEVEPKRFARFVGFRLWPVQDDLEREGLAAVGEARRKGSSGASRCRDQLRIP